MASQLNVKPKTIGQLFKSKTMYFYVPEFQRNYEWRTSSSPTAKDKQVDELFEDIYSAYENNDENYFLGTLITFYQEEVNDDRFGKYYVIDGQQRLTTLAILIRSYIKKLEKLKEEEGNRAVLKYKTLITTATGLIQKEMEIDGEDVPKKIVESSNNFNSEFLEEFFEELSIPDEKNHKNSKNLISAAISLEKKFDNEQRFKDGESCRKFYKYLLDHVYFSHVETDDFGEGFIVFERQNDRGKDLTFSDRIKHFLLTEVAKDRKVFDKKAGQINDSWEKLQMKVVKEASISFDDFLRYFFLSEYGVLKSKSGIVPWLKNKNDDGGYYITRMASHTDDFMKLLSNKVDEFVNIRNNIGPDGKTNYSLFYMKKYFSVKQNLPILMSAYPLGKDKFKRAALLVESLVFHMKWADARANYLERNLLASDNLCKYLINDKFEEFEKKIRKLTEEIAVTAKNNIIDTDFLEIKSLKGAPLMAKYIPHRVEYQLRLESRDGLLQDKVEDDDDQAKIVYDIEHIIERNNQNTWNRISDNPDILDEIRSLRNRIGNLCKLEWLINENVVEGWTPKEKFEGREMMLCKECQKYKVCKICKNDDICKKCGRNQALSKEKLKYLYPLPLGEEKAVCRSFPDHKLIKKNIKGYEDSDVYHTSVMSTGEFKTDEDLDNREAEVLKKYEFKKMSLTGSKLFNENEITERENSYFKVLSQAFLTEFDPHEKGFIIDRTIINWKDSEKKQSKR